MAEAFDPYYTWLGIPPEEQPADHYRLLGIRRFETNREVIANASDQRMTHLRTFQNGKRAAESQKLLNEISAATRCLLDAKLRPAYDAQLQAKLAAQKPVPAQAAPLPRARPYADPMPQAAGQPLPQAVVAQPVAQAYVTPAQALPQAIPATGNAAISVHASPAKPAATAPKQPANTGIIIAASVAGLILLSGAVVAVAGLAGVFNSKPEIAAHPNPSPPPPQPVPAPPNPTPTPTPRPAPTPTPTPSPSPAPQPTPQPAPNPPTVNVKSPAATSPTSQDNRTNWEFTGAPRSMPMGFREISPKRWQERAGPRQFDFEEIERNADYIELLDSTRNRKVRLYNDHFTFNQGDDRWFRAAVGRWAEPGEPDPQLVVDQPFNLLALDWNALKYGGSFSKRENSWVSGGQTGVPDRVQFPFEAPQEYTLDATFVRQSGDDALLFLINFGGRQGSIVLDGFPPNGHLSGLQWVDGRQLPAVKDPVVKRGPLLETGKEHQFHCEVTGDRIRATLDGDPLFDWGGPPERLSPDPFTRSPQLNRLALVTWHASYEIKRFDLTAKKLGAPRSAIVSTRPSGSTSTGPMPPNGQTSAAAAQRRFVSFRGNSFLRFDRTEPLLELSKPFTVELWFRCQADKPEATLVDAEGLRMRLQPVRLGSRDRTELYVSLGNARLRNLTPPLETGWHHVALCGDGDLLHCYLDGARVTAGRRPEDAAALKIIQVGMGQDRTAPFQGELAEFRLSSVARYNDRFRPEPLRMDSDTRLFCIPSLKGLAVQVNSGAGPSWQMSGASLQGGDATFPPAFAGNSSQPSASNSVASSPTPPPAVREPLPEAEALAAAKTRVLDVYGTKIKGATKADDKLKLSGELLQIAQNEKEPAAAYALLNEARALAVAGANTEAAFAAAQEVERRFEGDRFARIGKLLTELSSKVTGEQRDALLEEAMQQALSAMTAERYDAAEPAAQLAFVTASRGKELEKKKQTKALRDRMNLLKNSYEAAQAAAEKLKAAADDAAANLAVGKYRALLRGDWEAGLPHLAKCDDEKLASAAKAEQSASSGAEQLAAAEQWRSAADGFKGEDKAALQRHALEIFKRIAPTLSGLDQATADRRVKELEPIVADADIATLIGTRSGRSKPEPGLILRIMIVPNNVPSQVPIATPYLAVMRDPSELFRLPIGQSLVDYGSYQLRHVWAGQLILDQDADLIVELEDVNVRVGTQVVGGAATSRRRTQTVPWKKGSYPLLISSNDSSPYVRIFRADNGQNVLFHTDQDLQKELDKSVPLPKGGASKGIRIDK
jgi:hypothetical protein